MWFFLPHFCGNLWPNMAIIGSNLAINGHIWQYLSGGVHIWPFMAIFGNPWPYMEIYGKFGKNYCQSDGQIWQYIAKNWKQINWKNIEILQYITECGDIWPYMVIRCYIWASMTIVGNAWLYMAIYCHMLPSITILGNSWPYVAIYYQIWTYISKCGHPLPYVAIHSHI